MAKELIIRLIVLVAAIVLSVWLFNVIWSSDLPMWLKWLLLR